MILFVEALPGRHFCVLCGEKVRAFRLFEEPRCEHCRAPVEPLPTSRRDEDAPPERTERPV